VDAKCFVVSNIVNPNLLESNYLQIKKPRLIIVRAQIIL
jgi:hypothetical protein